MPGHTFIKLTCEMFSHLFGIFNILHMYPIYATNGWVFFYQTKKTATEDIGKVLKVRNLFSFIGGEVTVPWEYA